MVAPRSTWDVPRCRKGRCRKLAYPDQRTAYAVAKDIAKLNGDPEMTPYRKHGAWHLTSHRAEYEAMQLRRAKERKLWYFRFVLYGLIRRRLEETKS